MLIFDSLERQYRKVMIRIPYRMSLKSIGIMTFLCCLSRESKMSIVESHALLSVASSSIIKYERFQRAAARRGGGIHYLMVAHFAVPEVIEWRATTASAK